MNNESTRSTLGKFMIIASWVIIIGFLAVFFNDKLEKQRNPNQELENTSNSLGQQEVTLIRNRQGHYLATGHINGMKVEFLVDTGASDVAIPASVARRLQLKPESRVVYQTANGSVEGFRTTLDSVELGGIVLRQVPGGINPGMRDNQILLGMSFLKHLELIQKGNTLTIRQP
ncbi:MAG: TIGR02281 family clan AA aspartic protease [Gammaproteobacteria bacterium]|nr:TIGR02281 family clan AA aspartic protease [Gammaproteobacteria bacterium]